MKTRRIGETEFFPLGLGGMPMSITGRPAEADSIKVIHAAIDAGIDLIDTANVYCLNDSDLGHNEQLIAQALKTCRASKKIYVATKGGLTRTPSGDWVLDGNPQKLRTACDKSLRDLGVEQIFLYQLHAPDKNFSWVEQIAALAKLQEAGKIKHIGISNVTAQEIHDAQSVTRIETVQNRYNFAHQADANNGVFAACKQFGMTYLAYCPVGGGHAHKKLASNATIMSIGRKYDVSPYRVMLAWALAKGDFMMPIPGASKVSSIIDSAKAIAISLAPDDIALINKAS